LLAGTCAGIEDSCTEVSPPLTIRNPRWGDMASPFNPPSPTEQPDVTDINQLVAKYKKLTGAPSSPRSFLQPNLPELNREIGVSDLVSSVDAYKSFAYPFAGPCPCPSLAACGALACPGGAGDCTTSALPGLGSDATCIKTCRGGTNDGDPCMDHTDCKGGGICDKECLAGINVGKGCSSNSDCPNPPGANATCAIVTNNAFCRDRCGRCTP